ncbi:MAG TPA: hypothetical protein PLI49_19560 [Leptospiraceae bacterium]|nr:hypothetical protein [Leptospiraceae bacterium]
MFFINIFCEFKKKPSLQYSIPVSNVNVSATITESDGSTDLFEGTTTDTYTIVLNSNPNMPISIDIGFDSTQIKVNDNTTGLTNINFTPENWNQPQTVTVYALYDNIEEGSQKVNIIHAIKTSNPFQQRVVIGIVVATLKDNSGSKLTNSFQSGNVTLGATNPLTIPLTSSVNVNQSYVYCNFRYSSSMIDRTATCQLSSTGDSVIIEAGAPSTSSYVNWYVVEFSRGALVQRGSGSLTSTEVLKNISLTTSVDLSRTFVIGYSRGSVSNSSIDEQRTLRFRLSSNQNLEVVRNESGSQTYFEWQVIQLDGARVQSGITSILSGSYLNSSSISSINLNNSFLLINFAAGAGINGVEKNYLSRAYYSNNKQITFERYGNNDSVDISWYAIELIDGTSSQSGNTTLSPTSTSENATINSVDTGRTMIIFSNQVEDGDSPATTQDSGTFSSNFLDTTTIQFSRYNAESNQAIVSWYAIQFQ